MPRVSSLIIAVLVAVLSSLFTYFAVNKSLESNLIQIRPLEELQFKAIKLTLKQVDMDQIKCLLMVYDSPEWKESKIFLNCPNQMR